MKSTRGLVPYCVCGPGMQCFRQRRINASSSADCVRVVVPEVALQPRCRPPCEGIADSGVVEQLAELRLLHRPVVGRVIEGVREVGEGAGQRCDRDAVADGVVTRVQRGAVDVHASPGVRGRRRHVTEAVVADRQAPERPGASVAQDGTWAAGQHGCHPARLVGGRAVPDRIHPALHREQPSCPDLTVDLRPRPAVDEQLRPRDDAVLARGQRAVDELTSHIDVKSSTTRSSPPPTAGRRGRSRPGPGTRGRCGRRGPRCGSEAPGAAARPRGAASRACPVP
jgi:hypothetical protein